MQAAIQSRGELLIKPADEAPSISIIMPFDPKMVGKAELESCLNRAIKTSEDLLAEKYPPFTAMQAMKKIRALVKKLDYSTHKKSIGLLIGPAADKIIYMDLEVEEKIFIDQSFKTRDIIHTKQSDPKYLLLILTNNLAKIFFGNGNHLTGIVNNGTYQISDYINDAPEKVANFSDPHHRKEILSRKLIRHVDNGLSIILKAYPYPLLIVSTKKTKGYFMQISKNKDHVAEFIHGNHENATKEELKTLVQPYLDKWPEIKQKDLLMKIERAISNHKCAIGLHEVNKTVQQKRGKLLIVEKNYSFPTVRNGSQELQAIKQSPSAESIHIKDTVDDIIEKVLENGGDVEFVCDNALKEYKHIVLIQFY